MLLARPQLLLLIGDQNQLPPIPTGTFSLFASCLDGIPQLSTSLFERLLRFRRSTPSFSPTDTSLVLNTQYRCHPSIANLASSLFYHASLLNGPSTETLPLVFASLPRLVFIHNPASEEPCRGASAALDSFADSFLNNGEMRIIMDFLESHPTAQSLGVISLYGAQCALFHRKMPDSPIRFSTVDAFQGNEKDVIILSTVRSKSIGFSADPCRLNVAITRARSQLIIVGNRELLERDNLWKRVLAYIAKNGRFLDSASVRMWLVCSANTDYSSAILRHKRRSR